MGALDQVFFMIMDLLNEAFTLVMPVVVAILSLTIGSALVRMVYAWFAGSIGNMMGTGIMLIVLILSCLAFVWSAQAIVDGLGNFALTLGAGIVGADTMTSDQFAPSPMWSIADGQADKILATKAALCTSTWECIKTSGDQLMLEVAALFIYAAFAFLIFEIALTAIGYKTNGLFALLFAPMAILPFTKSFAEGAVQGWINHGVKLVLIAMVSGIAAQAFDLMDMPPKPVFDDIIPAVLMGAMIAFLAWQSRSLAASIISAAPQLSAQAISRGVGNVGRAIAGGAGLATSAAVLGNREKLSISSAAANIAGGMQRAPGRIAGAASTVRTGVDATKSYWDKVKAANTNSGNPGRGPGGPGTPTGGGGGAGSAPPQGNAASPASSPSMTQSSAGSSAQASSGFTGLSGERRFMVPENQLHSIGIGGGSMGTGWKNTNRASVRKHAIGTLTGQRAANAEKMAVAVARITHFGR